MPLLKGNQFRSANSFRDEPKSKPAPKQRVPKETAEDLPKFKLNDDRTIKIIGLFFLIISLYFMVAFTSYLFTWQDDQSYVIDANGGWSNLMKTQQELTEMGLNQPAVQNWLGKLGALLSHQFIYEWFGVASFLFIGVFFIIGYRMLFKIKVLSITKTLAYSFFLLIFTSVTFAFFHAFINDYPHFLEGEFGFWTNRLLQAQIGDAGTAGLLAFAGLSVLIIAYNIDFKLPERSAKPKYIVPETSDEVELEDEVLYAPVEFNLPNRPGQETTNGNTQKLSQNLPPVEVADEPEPEEHRPVVLSPAKNVPFETSQAVSDELKDSPPLTIEKTEEEKKSTELVEQFGMYDPTLDLSSYKYPTLDLLENYGSNKIAVNAEELEANKNKIVETLNHYNIEIDKIKATIGPTVTLYEIIPAPGVRISKIKNLEDDIALSLAALGIRIIAPMPGKGTIGIEVPNQHPEMVSMRSVLATEKFQNTTMDLPIALGKTISNEVYIADLSKMPHLLVAGATGQGKSVGINAILISLLYKMHPSQLKFVLVDPKKVELTLFRKIERHFLAKLPGEADAIITDTKKVITTLNSLCIEMDMRYDLLKNGHVRNLKEYNQKFISRKLNPNEGHRFLPFIVLIIDEFADLMMTAGKEVETPIARIAQLARAVGIHLVIATQRPSVNIITGTIKANFPARLAFRVLSKIDSRTILDSGGADQLIGRGDMLLSTGSDLIRIQCAFVDTPEVEKVSEFIGSQRGYPSAWMLPEYLDENADSSAKDFDASDRDPMFEEAARLIVMHQQGSTSLIQRKLKLGYNRAGRIIDQLEAANIVGPFEGSKAREVLIPDEYSLEQFLNTLDNND
ncbi:MAG: cell division protein FtsK [Sphingobacteriales bacterium 17-39-43]|uniref:FtsK/SpoIIIE family DNA translocase n=1 Tax=Daejeonella sp. TaxID=2805397 RepID=UPI000BC8E2CE|nr:DNA translocase FtsK [Daejeonella sp.]OYZ33178.1 MAG: cell division protein FtsK [Sphingobacteriales bacterium 16-39-50]OZA26587.1 MAG: cell division protein FtsK [Sphingobacteriales bacterium 17-39-43]HQT21742.1 DNA translocase FtsK [Daejeonella sp.]HQT56473.1 DNA translocase FtsK [Daejeonella sp.]